MPAETHADDLRSRFLDGMSHAACTVSVVTTDGSGGRAGVTVSAMSSVSADGERPTLLVCVHHLSPAAAAVVDNGVFCVNLLRDDQALVSDLFGGRRQTADGDKFSGVRWTAAPSGSPQVDGCLVAFDCQVQHHLRVGTHVIFFGAVQAISRAPKGSPLIYANRAYGTPVNFPAHRPQPTPAAPSTLRLGSYTSFAPYVLPAIFERMREDGAAPPAYQMEGDQRQVLEALRSGRIEIALTYDLDLGHGIGCEPLASLQPYALLPGAHPLAASDRVSLADLSQQPFVLLDLPTSRDYFLSLFEARGLRPPVAWRCASVEMVRGLVGHGLGCSILATKPANDVSYDGRALACRPLADPDLPPSRIVLAWHAGSERSPESRRFVDACRAHFGRPIT